MASASEQEKQEAKAKAEAEKLAKEKAKEAEKAEKAAKAEAEKLAKASKEPVLFDPKKLTAGSGTGFWKYNEDPKLVDRSTFQQQRARDFGIKANDIVIVVMDGKVETIGV